MAIEGKRNNERRLVYHLGAAGSRAPSAAGGAVDSRTTSSGRPHIQHCRVGRIDGLQDQAGRFRADAMVADADGAKGGRIMSM
jgi:hypothetical protein